MLGFKLNGYFVWTHNNLPNSVIVMKENRALYLYHNTYTAIIKAIIKDLENANIQRIHMQNYSTRVYKTTT